MRCANCNKDFDAKRKTARFCSARCRVYANRGVVGKVTEVPVDEVVQLGTFSTAEEVVAAVKEKVFHACKHGMPPTFCRFAKPGNPCR